MVKQEGYYLWNTKVIQRFKQLQFLEKIKMSDLKSLGNFLTPVFFKSLPLKPLNYYLSTKVTKETRKEMHTFLRNILVNITGEKELTWNLLDAMDVLLVTGIINII